MSRIAAATCLVLDIFKKLIYLIMATYKGRAIGRCLDYLVALLEPKGGTATAVTLALA